MLSGLLETVLENGLRLLPYPITSSTIMVELGLSELI